MIAQYESIGTLRVNAKDRLENCDRDYSEADAGALSYGTMLEFAIRW